MKRSRKNEDEDELEDDEDAGEEEGEEVIRGEEHEECGKRDTVKVKDPMKPSAEEVAEHGKSHLPFRSWCRHCVRGRAKNRGHWKDREQPSRNELHFDFCFL